MSKAEAYVGLTGPATPHEMSVVSKSVPAGLMTLLMVGVLVSEKTLGGDTNKYPERYPAMSDLRSVFDAASPEHLNLVHYATDHPEQLYAQMMEVARRAGPRFRGFQLNTVWPQPNILADYRQVVDPSYRIIVLQVGGRAMMECAHDPVRIAQRVATEYSGLVDYVLIDPSGGKGKGIDLEFAEQCLVALEPVIDVRAGIAGGLSGDNVGQLSSLRERHEFSIDAEGRLRDPKTDILNLTAVSDYLREGFRLFGEDI